MTSLKVIIGLLVFAVFSEQGFANECYLFFKSKYSLSWIDHNPPEGPSSGKFVLFKMKKINLTSLISKHGLLNKSNLGVNGNLNSPRPIQFVIRGGQARTSFTNRDPKSFIFSTLTGKVLEYRSGQTRAVDMTQVLSSLDLTTGYFPLIVDLKNNVISFGIGDGTRNRYGSSAQDQLLRNGGHTQLLRNYQAEQNDYMLNTNGVYGGGFTINSQGKIKVDFKSRGVNKTVDGLLPKEVEEALVEFVSLELSKMLDQKNQTPQLNMFNNLNNSIMNIEI